IDHAEPRRVGCRVLLRLQLGDAARSDAGGGRCAADGLHYRRHAASLVMLRQGYITRYLCERLAFGLAPESIKAFFVQRQRWARGAIQMLYLPEGPLGNFGRGGGLRLMHRLLFLPTHWLTQGLMVAMSIATPLVFIWTGLSPLVDVTFEAILY